MGVLVEAVVSRVHPDLEVAFVYDEHHHSQQQKDAEGHDAGGPLADGLLAGEVLLRQGQKDFAGVESRMFGAMDI